MNIYKKLELSQELLQQTAERLKVWSKDPLTCGYQHELMKDQAKKIFSHLHLSRLIINKLK